MMVGKTVTRRSFAMAGIGTVLGVRAVSAQPASPVAGGETRYQVTLPASSLPPAPVAVGAAGVTMSAGTIVSYPEGSAKRSVGIDHVLEGGYEIVSDSPLLHIDAAGVLTEVEPGEAASVAAGETVVILQNELAQQFTVGDAATRTLTVGVFTFEQGTGETEVEGTMESEILGGTLVQAIPETGLTVALVDPALAGSFADTVATVPVAPAAGGSWVVVFLPGSTEATPAP